MSIPTIKINGHSKPGFYISGDDALRVERFPDRQSAQKVIDAHGLAATCHVIEIRASPESD